MKLKLVLLFFAAIFTQTLIAQTDPDLLATEKPCDLYDTQVEPSFPGGIRAMYDYLGQNVVYPEFAKDNGTEGVVVLTFVVNKDGTISDVKIISDIGDGCGKTVQGVLQRMPKWSPGLANNHPVRVRYTIPYCFWLMDNEEDKRPAPPAPLPKRISRDQIWTAVENATSLVFGVKAPVDQAFNFNKPLEKRNALIEMLESSLKIKTALTDSSSLNSVADLSAYMFKAQYAPVIFFENGFRGAFSKYLTNRPNFEVKNEGYEKMWSLQVPEGIKMILYNKPNYEGKSLEINALDGTAIIPDLSKIRFEKGIITFSSKSYVDWSKDTKSIQIILPNGFPVGY